jgi:PKD repeat protein
MIWGTLVPESVHAATFDTIGVTLRIRDNVWPFETDGAIISSPAIADLDGDETLEIIVGSNDRKVYCIGKDSGFKWEYSTGAAVSSSPAAANITGDAALEVVVGSEDGKLYCFDKDGVKLWEFTTAGKVTSSPTVVDIDGDGDVEIFVGSWDQDLYCVDANGTQVWSYHTDGPVSSSPAVADVDKDGSLDVVFGSHDGRLYALDKNGVEVWVYNTNDIISYASPTIADLDDDGNLETLIGTANGTLHCVDNVGLRVWEYPLGTLAVLSCPAVADLDGDGNLEILLGYGNKRLYNLNKDGIKVWDYTAGGSISLSSPAVVDLDSDGDLEILVGSHDARVYCIDAHGAKVWDYQTGGSINSSPALADLDRDGSFEVVIGSNDTKLHAVDVNGNAFIPQAENPNVGFDPAPWPDFHRDLENTGFYPRSVPPVLAPIGDFVAEAGEWFSIPRIFAHDLNGDTMTMTLVDRPNGARFFETVSQPGYVEYKFRWPDKFVAPGQHTMTFVVTDAQGNTDEETITITVVSTVNDPPSLAPIGNQSAIAGEWFSIPEIVAHDVDGDEMTIYIEDQPEGIRLFPTDASRPGFAVYKLRWPAAFVNEGDYTMKFIVSDGRGGTDEETITVFVRSAPQQNVELRLIGDQTAMAGVWFGIPKIVATDVDGDLLTITATNLASGMRFFQYDSQPGYVEYKLRWPPQFVQKGTYTITFTASDGNGNTDEETITIVVTHPPILAPIGNYTITEGQWFSIPRIIATDADNDAFLTIEAKPLPSGLRFFQTSSALGYVEYKLRWPDRFVVPGVYTITFTATDGLFYDSETITITVASTGGGGDSALLEPKSVAIEAIPETGLAPLTIDFAALLSRGWQPDCTWDFGDGIPVDGASTTYLYDTPGDYQVDLDGMPGMRVLPKAGHHRVA